MSFSDTELGLIKSAPLLGEVPAHVVNAAVAAQLGEQLLLPPDTVFLKAGQRQTGLWVIAHGTIETFIVDAAGREKILDFAAIGGTLGEETLFGDRPLQYTARSLTQAAVLQLPETLVAEWMERYPPFARRLTALIAERIDYLGRDVLTFCTKKATARLVCYLVCHFNQTPASPDGTHSLHLAIPRNKLASRLSISDSHLSRAFRELEEASLIVRQGRGYFIPDVAALSQYVCPAGCDF
ncbi:cyclic nucleotide-binding domain-containing protein [Rhodocyclus tenuis]|uniref:Crp/Fnr family transcriptional regulator n=1 Tax=Rhodocyclus gracilis TaxID=2929842 RepID=UPI001298A1E9|nr:Crp/Fnr family transcriptional regulator [Rhodocyclus gracilis]MRD72494.1 cyclic nucleotide-binding domain-containing protein [Rhodocyclus gracilis]